MTTTVATRCISLDCRSTPRYLVANLRRLGSETLACGEHLETALSEQGPHLVQPITVHGEQIDSPSRLLRWVADLVDEQEYTHS